MAEEKIYEFFKQIGINIKNADLFIEALTHKSYNDYVHYQRLEFLGDSILSFFSSEYLFESYENANEGELSRMRTRIVSREALINVFDELNFNDILKINRKSFSEEIPESIKADIIESTLAAVYLDSGIRNARKYFKFILKHTGEVPDYFFAKNLLQEMVLKRHKYLPEFSVVSENDYFNCKIYINGEYIADAKAKTKKECEKRAAAKALNIMKRRYNEDNSLH